MRRVCYVSGTRADFGLMASTLALAHARLALSVCVTGMHLSAAFGQTVREVEAAGLRICARVPVEVEKGTGASMAIALGQALVGMTEVFAAERPQLVMVLGDRGEMLAGALAAIHLNIPVVHVHGGERSGTVDEPVRHAISKLAHYHFAATEASRDRLIRMGERPDHIFVTGAPGLDGLRELAGVPREQLYTDAGLDPNRPTALVVFHPVLQQAAVAAQQTEELLKGVLANGYQALCLMPNADAGSLGVRGTLAAHADHPDVRVVTHFGRDVFVSWMAAADVMVGNSSSGIIEAASLGLPVVNVGDRQLHRERSGNVLDVPADADLIARAIASTPPGSRWAGTNVYGNGEAGQRIVALLETISLAPETLLKSNTY